MPDTAQRPRLRARFLALLATVAVLATLALAAIIVARDGGCDRTPPDDDDMEPACEPGDKECYGAQPGRPAT